jgi:ribosome-associated toxin RatA of RatAB toxin-antitoxin module
MKAKNLGFQDQDVEVEQITDRFEYRNSEYKSCSHFRNIEFQYINGPFEYTDKKYYLIRTRSINR